MIYLFGTQPDPAIRAALRRIETKLDLLLERAGIEIPEDDFLEVRELAKTGQKIQAIKRYREMTGAGLAEAKAAVESM